MNIDIPGRGEIKIETIILDLNGTLTVGGEIVSGAAERLALLSEKGLRFVLLTGNTRGDADEIASQLGIEWQQAKTELTSGD